MFQTIKSKLLISPFIIVISFIGLYFLVTSNLHKLDDKAYKASLANKMIKNMLEARIAEKNFTRRKDEQYIQILKEHIKDNFAIADDLKSRFDNAENKKSVVHAKKLYENYLSLFMQYKNLRTEADSSEQNMIKVARIVKEYAISTRSIIKRQRDKLIKKSAPLSQIVDKMTKASLTNKIIKELSEIRLAEKNYIRRKDASYKNEIYSSIEIIDQITTTLSNSFKKQTNKETMVHIDTMLKEYTKNFEKFVDLREKSFTVSINMKKNARDAKSIALNIRAEQKKQRIEIKDDFKNILLVLFMIIGFIIVFISIYIIRIIVKDLSNIEDAAKDLALGEGDLTKRIKVEGKHEISRVADHVNTFIQKVQKAISESKHVSAEASSISHELSATSLEIGKRVEEESVLVQDVNKNAETTMQESEFVDDMVKKMHEISDKSFNELEETTMKINSLITTVKESSVKEIELSDKMQELKRSTNDVKSILELIGDIAEQTNLLSLNAAIEAARAGEHGRGFAVVADEVRKLAENTQKSLVEINATINVVTQGVEEASDDMQANAKEVESAAQQAGDVEESITGVMHSIEATKTMSMESSQAVDQLKSRIGDISTKMKELNDVSNSNARSVEEIAAAAEHQNEIIDNLNEQLSRFKS